MADNVTYKNHLEKLCIEHNIKIHLHTEGKWSQSGVSLKDRIVHTAKEIDFITYTVVLHEIGHLLGPYQSKARSIQAEVGAWIWAKENHLNWSNGCNLLMSYCLKTYLTKYPLFDVSVPSNKHPCWQFLLAEPYLKDLAKVVMISQKDREFTWWKFFKFLFGLS